MADEDTQRTRLENAILGDAWISALRALATIEVTPADEAAISEVIAFAKSQEMDISLSVRELAPELTPGLLASVFVAQLQSWDHGGAASFSNLVASLDDDIVDLDHPLLVAITAGLTAMKRDLHPAIGDRAMAVRAFDKMAEILERGSHNAEALACALSATNFLKDPTWDQAEVPLRRALRLCRQENRPDSAGICLVKLAEARLRSADSVEPDLTTFALLEELIRTPPGTVPQRIGAARALNPLLERRQKIPMLRKLVMVALLQDTAAAKDHTAAQLLPMLPFEWNLTSDDLEARLSTFREVMTDVEDERFAMLPPIDRVQAEASWTDFTFRHPVLERMMPVGTAFRKITNFHETLLAIHHELTHVVTCLGSHIGLWVLALRAAIFETELDLWSLLVHLEKAQVSTDIFARGLAPLSGADGDPLALALAERELELFRKATLLQETWAPWFEGVAVFAEIHGDTTDDEALSDMSMVMMNLEDQTIVRDAPEGSETIRRVTEKGAEAERAYAAAAREVGPYRLRTYLDDYARKYLPGYFAVRSVVAAWRARLPRPLPGGQALRAIIHLTKFGSDEAVPNLGLPVDDFGRAAVDNLATWIEKVSEVSQEDLERVLTTGAGEAFSWRAGQLLVDPEGDASGDIERRFEARLREALSTMAAPHASPNRAGTSGDVVVDDVLASFLDHVAERLARPRPGRLVTNYALVDRLASRYLILPIAETTAPVWLNVSTDTMIVVLRASDGTGPARSRHIVFRVALPADRAAALRQNVAASGATRVTVTRVTFLGQWLPDRRTGWNYLVFRLGDWCHVIPSGMLFGDPAAPPEIEELIRARFYPSDLASMEENVAALGARCAQRTATWLKNVATWGGEADSPLSIWAAHVQQLAEQLIVADGANAAQAARASRALLSFALGSDAAAETALAQGLRLGADGGTWLMVAIRLLSETGTTTMESLPTSSGSIPASVFEQIFHEGPHGWDFRPGGKSATRSSS